MKEIWDEFRAQQAEILRLQAELAGAAGGREAVLTERVQEQAEELADIRAWQAQAIDQIRRLGEDLRAAHEALRFAEARAAQVKVQGTPPGPWPVGPLPAAEPPHTGPAAQAAPASGVQPANDSTGTLEAVFQEWCRRAGGLNSQIDLFTTFVRETFPAADVRTVYRDADSPARPVVLTAERAGNSAVPFWAVSCDGRHWLVPQPMGTDQFRELAPCFAGQANPTSLSVIEPAALSTFGSGFELAQQGRVG